MTREQAREKVRELLNAGSPSPLDGYLVAVYLDVLLSEPGTCATCQHWEENTNQAGVGLGDGRCYCGVRVGAPARQEPDGGLYTPRAFYCPLHTPKPGGNHA